MLVKVFDKMQVQSNELTTQRDRVSAALMEISVNVTAKDRQAYMAKFQTSSSTVSDYLRGNVMNVDRAFKMLEFFRERINKRESLL